MTIMSSISSRYADAVASLAKAVAEVKTFEPDYEEEYIVSEGALGNNPEQPGLVIGVGATALSPVTLQMLWNPVGKALAFAHDGLLCNMPASRVVLIANTNDNVSDVFWPNHRRRTFVMSYLSRELVLREFVLFISHALHQLGAILRILVPTPALSAHRAGTVARRDWDNYAHWVVLSVASPKFRGSDEDRPHLEYSGGRTVFGNEPAEKQAANARKAKRDRRNDWKTRQLWVDAITYEHIQELVASVEAKGPSELIRRALRAREDFHPEDDKLAATVTTLQVNQDERLNITLPPSSWERVERLKQETGKTFRTLVYEAILVFAELHAQSEERGDDSKEGGQVFVY